MLVKRVNPSGYCAGVKQAIDKVKQAIKQYPDSQIYIIGMIVHNQYVVDAFSNLNVITLTGNNKLELINQIDSGVVIFTAHGIDPKVKQKAIDKGLIVIDASCPNVLKNQKLILDYLQNDYDIIYIGKKNHQESDAVIALSNKVHLVENSDDINALTILNSNIFLTNQTTMSILDINTLIIQIKDKYPNIVVKEEICNATRLSQQALTNLNTNTLIVVGDPKSNNTTQLANIALHNNINNVIKVANSLELSQFNIDEDEVYITAGASTPELLIDNCIKYLETKEDKYLQNDIKDIL